MLPAYQAAPLVMPSTNFSPLIHSVFPKCMFLCALNTNKPKKNKKKIQNFP